MTNRITRVFAGFLVLIVLLGGTACTRRYPQNPAMPLNTLTSEQAAALQTALARIATSTPSPTSIPNPTTVTQLEPSPITLPTQVAQTTEAPQEEDKVYLPQVVESKKTEVFFPMVFR